MVAGQPSTDLKATRSKPPVPPASWTNQHQATGATETLVNLVGSQVAMTTEGFYKHVAKKAASSTGAQCCGFKRLADV